MPKTQGIGSIQTQKRNGTNYYIATISLGYDLNGKQIRRTKGSYKKKEVVEWLKEVNTKTFSKISDMTLAEVVEKYINDYKAPTVSPLTLERYIARTKLYIKSRPIGDMKVNEITQTQMQAYANDLVANASNPIAHEVTSMLNTIFRRLSDKGQIDLNPCCDIVLPKYKKQRRPCLSAREQMELTSELDVLNDKSDLAIYLALVTGLRLGEVCGLKWSDIKSGVIHVQRQFGRVKGTEFDIKCTKTEESVRQVPVNTETNKILNKLKSTGYIFSDDGIKPFDRKRIQRRFNDICKKHNIDCCFHSLRHTFASNAVSKNVNLFILKSLMGHTNISTTAIYAHTQLKDMQDSVKMINDDIKLSL